MTTTVTSRIKIWRKHVLSIRYGHDIISPMSPIKLIAAKEGLDKGVHFTNEITKSRMLESTTAS